MGNGPSGYEPRTYGEAKLRLALEDGTSGFRLSCSSAWYTADGDLSEAGLDVTGGDGELYDTLQEVMSWLYRRWKRPLVRALAEDHGPFDERPV